MAKKEKQDKEKKLMGYTHCTECHEVKHSKFFGLHKIPPVKGMVNFSVNMCDDCVIALRHRAKKQVIDCRVEDNYVVKTLQPGHQGEPFDKFSCLVADVTVSSYSPTSRTTTR
jgi:hypothetical protein